MGGLLPPRERVAARAPAGAGPSSIVMPRRHPGITAWRNRGTDLWTAGQTGPARALGNQRVGARHDAARVRVHVRVRRERGDRRRELALDRASGGERRPRLAREAGRDLEVDGPAAGLHRDDMPDERLRAVAGERAECPGVDIQRPGPAGLAPLLALPGGVGALARAP